MINFGWWSVSGMLAIEIRLFNNAGICKDKIQATFTIKDVLKYRRERPVVRNIGVMKDGTWPEFLGCSLSAGGIKIEKVNSPASFFNE